MRFGDMVREYRLRLGWTQEGLAERSGVSTHAIGMLEAGRRNPRLKSVAALADALGLADGDRAELIAAARAEPARAEPAGPRTDAGANAGADVETGAPRPAAVRAPAQLPADLPDFTSRTAALDAVRHALGRDGTAGRTPVLVVTGPGGIGKTSLAVHAAHAHRDRYPDGQLFASLRGADQAPVPAAEVAARLLRALGVSPTDVPPALDERAALYRSLLTGRRVLIVLDDVLDGAQIRPVLPASSGCAVLLTSRSRLPELDCVERIELAAFTDTEARDLLGRIADPAVLSSEPDATTELLAHCAGLPLALRITGSRLVTEPGRTVRMLAERLADARGRLDELRVGDRAVRVSFEASYAHLAPDQAAAFRLLALVPGRSVGVPAAAALLDRDPAPSERLLAELTAHHLLQVPESGRYGFHDLIRLYAQERARNEDAPAGRRAAERRLALWYLHASRRAGMLLVPHARLAPAAPPPPGLPQPDFDGAEAAMAWYETERANLVDLVRHAAGRDDDPLCWQLAHSLWPFFTLRKYWGDWNNATGLALDHARRSADRTGEALMLVQAGTLAHAQGDYREAITRYRHADGLLGDGDPEATAMIEANLGVSHRQLQDYETAIGHLTRAADAFRTAGDRYGEAVCLLNLIPAYRVLGRYDPALVNCRLALAAFQALGSRYGEGHALHVTAQVLQDTGDFARALDLAGQAVAIREDIGDRDGTASALEQLGIIRRHLGQAAAAAEAWRRSLALYEELGSPKAENVRRLLAKG
ncbi:ATP-binding protein [Kitasatospora sp. NPDC059747]|uniref:ATP-binding protein n=1 Tax=Kitasatospora sp. NPDC059747 TaxID=3346930 RepID=UPI0036490F6E